MSSVAHIMTKNPRTVGPATSVVSAAKTMRTARVGSLFVKKGKQLVGIEAAGFVDFRKCRNAAWFSEQRPRIRLPNDDAEQLASPDRKVFEFPHPAQLKRTYSNSTG